MKKCTRCKKEKDYSLFCKNKTTKDGYKYNCKQCDKDVRDLTKEKRCLGLRNWRSRNKEHVKEYKKEYEKNNKDKKAKWDKKYRGKNKDYLRIKSKIYRENNKEKISLSNKKYQKENKKRIKIKRKIWESRNKEKQNKFKRDWDKKRSETDYVYCLKKRLRCLTYQAFRKKGYNKKSKTFELLGAECDVVFNHLENKFTDGMSWKNRSDWHIDHIIPLASAKTEDDLIKLCHYTNLQPLWIKDNLSKGSKLNWRKEIKNEQRN